MLRLMAQAPTGRKTSHVRGVPLPRRFIKIARAHSAARNLATTGYTPLAGRTTRSGPNRAGPRRLRTGRTRDLPQT